MKDIKLINEKIIYFDEKKVIEEMPNKINNLERKLSIRTKESKALEKLDEILKHFEEKF